MSRLVAFAALALLATASPVVAAPPTVVQAEIAHIAQGIDGVVGVAAWRLDGKGPRVLVNADQLYPMASTFKVPIAGTVLSQVDSGRIRAAVGWAEEVFEPPAAWQALINCCDQRRPPGAGLKG